jgi:hypothetical protein
MQCGGLVPARMLLPPAPRATGRCLLKTLYQTIRKIELKRFWKIENKEITVPNGTAKKMP